MGRSGFRASIALGLAVAGVIAGPAAAADQPDVAVAPSGAARFASTTYPTGLNPPDVIATRGLTGGTLDAPQDLSPSTDCGEDVSAEFPQVALTDAGDAWMTWSQSFSGDCNGVFARHRRADGTLDPTRPVSVGAAFLAHPRLAVTPGGGAISVAEGRTLVATRLQPDGTASAPIAVTSNRVSSPDLAVAPNGDVVFVWEKITGGVANVRTRILRANGSLTPAHDVSASTQLVGGGRTPQVAVDGQGRTTFVWREPAGSNIIALTRIRRASGAFGLIHQLTEPHTEEGSAAGTVELAADDHGDVIFLWDWQRDWLSDGPFFVQARARTPGGEFGPLLRVSPTGRNAAAGEAGIDEDGVATLTWERFDGSHWIAQARRHSASTGTLGSVKNLSAAGEDAREVQVALAPAGAAVFAWTVGTTPLDPFHCEACGIAGRRMSATGSLGSVLDVG